MSTHGAHGAHGSMLGKRKDRNGADQTPIQPGRKPGFSGSDPAKPCQPADNLLLAGYLAQEFLTRGTLLGRQFQPGKIGPNPNPNPGRAESESEPVKQGNAYVEVSYLLMRDRAHIPGVVNPTQLARWLRM